MFHPWPKADEAKDWPQDITFSLYPYCITESQPLRMWTEMPRALGFCNHFAGKVDFDQTMKGYACGVLFIPVYLRISFRRPS